jgi:tRNA-2-methylthio-N6-dimethylallyladenosine synthase
MYVYDSEHMAMNLACLGYTPALSPEDADLVIVNTCSVRDKAEQKAFSILGRLEGLKRRRPGLIVGWPGVSPSRKASEFSRAPRGHRHRDAGGSAAAAHVLKVEVEHCRVVDLELTRARIAA